MLQVNPKGKADGSPLTNEFPVLYNTHVNKIMYLEHPHYNDNNVQQGTTMYNNVQQCTTRYNKVQQ